MRTTTAKVTSKRQVTLPKELAAILGVEPGDRLLFTEDEGEVRVVKDDWATRTSRILSNSGVPLVRLSREEERRLFEEGVAEDPRKGMDGD